MVIGAYRALFLLQYMAARPFGQIPRVRLCKVGPHGGCAAVSVPASREVHSMVHARVWSAQHGCSRARHRDPSGRSASNSLNGRSRPGIPFDHVGAGEDT